MLFPTYATRFLSLPSGRQRRWVVRQATTIYSTLESKGVTLHCISINMLSHPMKGMNRWMSREVRHALPDLCDTLSLSPVFEADSMSGLTGNNYLQHPRGSHKARHTKRQLAGSALHLFHIECRRTLRHIECWKIPRLLEEYKVVPVSLKSEAGNPAWLYLGGP